MNSISNADISKTCDNVAIDDNIVDEFAWIEQEEKDDQYYDHFYLTPVTEIDLFQILLDTNGRSCLSSSRSKVQLNVPGILQTSELAEILLCQKRAGFRPYVILRFNPDIESCNIQDFLNMDEEKVGQFGEKWLEEVSYTTPIVFTDTVGALGSVNSLIVIYKKKRRVNKNNTDASVDIKNTRKHNLFGKIGNTKRQTRRR